MEPVNDVEPTLTETDADDRKSDPSPWRGRIELGAACAVVAAVSAVAFFGGSWPFEGSPRELEEYGADPSLWQLLLADETVLGFVRLGVVALALFVIASVPALIVAGRWLKGMGTGGISADEKADARVTIRDLTGRVETLTAELQRVKEQRNRANATVRRAVRLLKTMAGETDAT